jgi:hypothetical protein
MPQLLCVPKVSPEWSLIPFMVPILYSYILRLLLLLLCAPQFLCATPLNTFKVRPAPCHFGVNYKTRKVGFDPSNISKRRTSTLGAQLRDLGGLCISGDWFARLQGLVLRGRGGEIQPVDTAVQHATWFCCLLLNTLCSCTPALCTLLSVSALCTLYSALCLCTHLHSTLHTALCAQPQQSASLRSALTDSALTLCTLHSALCTLLCLSALCTLHLRIQHSAICALRSVPCTALCSLLAFCSQTLSQPCLPPVAAFL